MDEYLVPALLFLAGLIAGFINTLAGGGSILTLPALILAGLTPAEANATNRIAALLQASSATVRFSKKGMIPSGELSWTVPWMLAGGAMGALSAVIMPARIFEPLLYTLIAAAGLMVFIKQEPEDGEAVGGPWKYPALLATGFYGGFIQAGAGYILLWALHSVSGLPFKKSNALKVLLVIPFTAISLLIFHVNGLVRYIPGLMLAAGSVSGAWAGVAFMEKVSVKKIKILMMVLLILVLALNLLK